MRLQMAKIIKFDRGGKDDGGNFVKINRMFCGTCGNGLDLWAGDNGVAYGLCTRCDFQIGEQPIEFMALDED